MIINYKQDVEGWLLTPCPHGINITGLKVAQVGSASCVCDCVNFVSNDTEKLVLVCKREVGKFFVEIEETTKDGSVRHIQDFPCKGSRNLFMKIIDTWKSVKITRFGQGVWKDA